VSTASSSSNGPQPATGLLLPQHLADLRRSGLSDDQIQACCFHSLQANEDVQQALRWSRYSGSLGPCLCIPYRHADGAVNGYCRLKPDRPRRDRGKDQPVKYEAPKGLPNRAYFPPGTVAILADPSAPLLITEGEKKAAKADQEGFACVGLSGVYAWQKKRKQNAEGNGTGRRELIDDLASIPWQGRQVHVAFDSDAVTNDNVLWAEWHLSKALAERGAVVKIVRLPASDPGPDGKRAKVGLDDYLVAHGPEAFRKLMETATAPTAPARHGSDRPPVSVAAGASAAGDHHHLTHDGRANLTDVGNGKRLADRHGADLRQCHPWKKWVVWDGRCWQPDATATATRCAKETIASLARWAANQVAEISNRLKEMADDES
jgi:hypothetical protein